VRGRSALTGVVAAAGLAVAGLPAAHAASLPPVVNAPAPGPATVDYGYDAGHTFDAADPSITPPLGSLWSVALSGDPSQLLAADQLIFALIEKPSAAHPTATYLYALDPLTGRTKWNLLVPNGSEIAYESGVVAVAGGDHVQAFKAAAGAALWNVALAGAAALTPADGQLYADATGDTSTAQTIEALDINTGKVIWSAKPPLPEGAGPLAVAGDWVYLGEGNQAQAFDRTNGKLLWSVHTGQTAAGPATATLSSNRVFTPVFTPGSGAPGTTVNGPGLLNATGAGQTGATASIVSGDTGLQRTPQGTIATDVATATYIWSAFAQPLSILNGEAVAWGKNAIELRSLASGKLDWYATMTGSASSIVTAVGNGELLVGTAGHLTALLPYLNSAVPKVAVKTRPAFATYHGSSAKVTGSLAQPGTVQSYRFTVASRPVDSPKTSKFVNPRVRHTKPDGTFALTEHPELDTVYRISLPGSSVALSLFEIVALPQIKYQFGKPAGSHGQVTITLTTPRRITLGGHQASLYIGRAKSKRYELLGTGHLHGKKGHYTATFKFKLEKHVAKADFVTACFAGLYKQGMSYGDHLDRRCGNARIPF
jgi:outer membrane protein assembly factor BamB